MRKNEITLFCGNCKHLTPTESEQSEKKEPHWCKKYNEQVKHNGHHPMLPRLEQCIKDFREKIKTEK